MKLASFKIDICTINAFFQIQWANIFTWGSAHCAHCLNSCKLYSTFNFAVSSCFSARVNAIKIRCGAVLSWRRMNEKKKKGKYQDSRHDKNAFSQFNAQLDTPAIFCVSFCRNTKGIITSANIEKINQSECKHLVDQTKAYIYVFFMSKCCKFLLMEL